MSSLAQKTLHRIRYRDGRVIFDEPIRIGLRIRDLDQLADGTIVLWADDTSIVELKPIALAVPNIEDIVSTLRGSKRQEALGTIASCQECHSVSPLGVAENAPSLWGVFGREIAGTTFDGYSDGLKNKTGTWNENSLDAYLKDVEEFSRGSNMAFPGITDDTIRSMTIKYLRSLRVSPDGEASGCKGIRKNPLEVSCAPDTY